MCVTHTRTLSHAAPPHQQGQGFGVRNWHNFAQARAKTAVGRGAHGVEECEAMQSIVDGVGAGTRILVASIRQPSDLSTLAAQGLDTFTFSPKIARSLFAESLTTKAAESFERAAARGGAYETAIDPLGEDLFVNGIEDEDF